MTVKELIALLQTCNPDATVVTHVDVKFGDYTWDTEHREVTGVLPWPEPKEEATTIELIFPED